MRYGSHPPVFLLGLLSIIFFPNLLVGQFAHARFGSSPARLGNNLFNLFTIRLGSLILASSPGTLARTSLRSAGQTPSSCGKTRKRQEWRQMTRRKQASYMRAVKCLTTKPSVLSTQFNLRHYDDFQFVHSSLYLEIHFVARFLAWHRHLIHLYELSLNECGYSGGIPRWDWTLDAQNATQSPIWSSDPETGFGGNGTGRTDPGLPEAGGAVVDGAFANFQLIHPIPHLLHRNWDDFLDLSSDNTPYLGQFYGVDNIRAIQSIPEFWDYATALEGQNPSLYPDALVSPHSAIHAWVGGEFPSSVYAANEPLFFLHHANIDWLWAQWQNQDPENRLQAYRGNNVRGSQNDDASLNDTMRFLGLGGRDPTVAEVMDTTAYPYCYTYA